MNENDTKFSDISLDDGTNTILVTSADGKKFVVTVSPLAELT